MVFIFLFKYFELIKKQKKNIKLTKNSKKNQLLPNAKSRVAPDETTH